MDIAALKFGCDGCGRLFSWKPSIAGRQAKCPCGVEMTVPADPPGMAAADLAPQDIDQLEDNGAYAFKEEEPAKAVVTRPQLAPTVADEPTSGQPRRTVAYAGTRSKREQEKAARAAIAEGGMIISPVKDLWAPLALVGEALGAGAVYGGVLGGVAGGVAAVLVFGVFVAVRSALMLGVAWISAGWLDVSFGHPLTAAFKLFGTILFVTMLAENLYLVGGAWGWLLGWAVSWVSLLALLCWLFDMELGTALNFSVLCSIANNIMGWILVIVAARAFGLI